jgi:phosphate transport system substrate-binding protein
VKVSLVMRAVGASAIAAVGLAACGSNSNGPSATDGSGGSSGCANGSLTGQGSTFQANIEKQWIAQFTAQCSGAQITYTGTGSGAGVQQFGSGTIDFAGTDAVMKPDEQAAADRACGSKAIHIPVTAGGVALIYNLPGVSNLQLSAATLAGIFDGKITKWNDPSVAADNPGAKLPSTTVKTYHRSDGSGTTKVFSSFLDAMAHSDWKLGSDKTLNWPSGQGANGSSGVVAGVQQTAGGITYAEVSYAQQASLPTAKIKGAGSDFVGISAATVSQAIDSGFTVTGSGNDLAGTLDFAKMQGYPISTVSYVAVCSHYKDAKKGTLVKDYLAYAAGDGQSQADQLGFAPLPSTLAAKDKTAIAAIS